MTQADRVHSTPPQTRPKSPVDPTRRRLLAVAATANLTATNRPDATDLLRVGSLELDLANRTAKRGCRSLDLRGREFRLLGYMMRHHDEILTRAVLLQEVWHYKFMPETNLVEVHMGKLLRKVDELNEAQMIRNIRGAGFILNASDVVPP